MSKKYDHSTTTAASESKPSQHSPTISTAQKSVVRVEIPQKALDNLSAGIRSNLPAEYALHLFMLSDGLEHKCENSSGAIHFEIPGSVHVRDLRANYKRILRRNVALATNPALSMALAAVAASVQSIFSQPEPVSCLSILVDGTLHICITNRDAKGAYSYAILLTRVSPAAVPNRDDDDVVTAKVLEKGILSINDQIYALNARIGNLESNLEVTSAYVKSVDSKAVDRFDRAECTIKWWRWITLLILAIVLLQALLGGGDSGREVH
jgi:hypothetical protein